MSTQFNNGIFDNHFASLVSNITVPDRFSQIKEVDTGCQNTKENWK